MAGPKVHVVLAIIPCGLSQPQPYLVGPFSETLNSGEDKAMREREYERANSESLVSEGVGR
jgi:CDGSH-type Zn-finger protein